MLACDTWQADQATHHEHASSYTSLPALKRLAYEVLNQFIAIEQKLHFITSCVAFYSPLKNVGVHGCAGQLILAGKTFELVLYPD